MQIIKKIDNDVSLSSLNDSIKALPCYGISLEANYDWARNLTIKGESGSVFAAMLDPTKLTLNFHLFSERRLYDKHYVEIAQIFAKLKNSPRMILSSSQSERQELNELRQMILEHQGSKLSSVFVASSADLLRGEIEIGDMMYSSGTKSKANYEFDRLSDYVNNGVPVLLDWPDNNQDCISRMIEKTTGSDNLIVLARKPQTTRGILASTIR